MLIIFFFDSGMVVKPFRHMVGLQFLYESVYQQNFSISLIILEIFAKNPSGTQNLTDIFQNDGPFQSTNVHQNHCESSMDNSASFSVIIEIGQELCDKRMNLDKAKSTCCYPIHAKITRLRNILSRKIESESESQILPNSNYTVITQLKLLPGLLPN